MDVLRLGDRVMCTDNGELGNIIEIDADFGGAVVLFDNGEETWLETDLLELDDTTKEESVRGMVKEFIQQAENYTTKEEIIKLIEELWS